MFIADAAESLKEILRGRHVSAFSLHSFNYNCRDFIRRRGCFEKPFLDPVQRALTRATVAAVRRIEGIAKLVWIRHVHDVERLAFKTAALRDF